MESMSIGRNRNSMKDQCLVRVEVVESLPMTRTKKEEIIGHTGLG